MDASTSVITAARGQFGYDAGTVFNANAEEYLMRNTPEYPYDVVVQDLFIGTFHYM